MAFIWMITYWNTNSANKQQRHNQDPGRGYSPRLQALRLLRNRTP